MNVLKGKRRTTPSAKPLTPLTTPAETATPPKIGVELGELFSLHAARRSFPSAFMIPKKPVSLKSTLTKSASGWYYLTISPEIAKRFETDPKTRRVVCTLNGSHSFQCALLPNRGQFCIGISKPIREKLQLHEGSTVMVRLQKDTSKYGGPMPEEFDEVLRQDAEGDRLFHALTAGMQRSLLYMIGSVKNIDKRIHLGLIVLEHLKENGGKVVAEQLQHDIKRPIF